MKTIFNKKNFAFKNRKYILISKITNQIPLHRRCVGFKKILELMGYRIGSIVFQQYVT